MNKTSSSYSSQQCPYDLLAPVGITPQSSMQQIRSVMFSLMEQNLMTPARREAWDTLRRLEQRLAVDFFMVHTEHGFGDAQE